MVIMKPMDIEKRSMEIIESELSVPLSDEHAPIVKRVIHATADFSFAENMKFSDEAVQIMRDMMKSGASIITDTNMALAGINKAAVKKLGISLSCFMADESIAEEAAMRGTTRAEISMERALSMPEDKLLVCGNAPTFLMPLIKHGKAPGIAVIAVPVGFVNVVETKEQIWQSAFPCIVAMGRRGGSNVAAAIVNALMYGINGARV